MFHQDYFTRTLRWVEPHNGWGDHHSCRHALDIRKTNNDSGFCNRLLHWELAYIINEKLNFDYKILLQYQHWPEMDLLDMPHTHVDYSGINDRNDLFWNFDYERLKFKTVFDVRKNEVKLADKISLEMAEEMFNTNNFLNLKNSNHWYSDFGFKTMTKIDTSWYNSKRPLSTITLKHKKLEDFLVNNVHNVVGIHLRRFNGVDFKEQDYEKIPVEFRNDLKKINSNKSVSDTGYDYINDIVYFNIMDKLLKINPQQVFYISTDLPIKFLKPFISRYGNKILHSDRFEHKFVTYLYNANMDIKFLEKYANVITNVIDLFSLSNCPFIIGAPQSTWTEFAHYYSPKKCCYINDDIDEIISLYTEFNNNKSSLKSRII